MSNELIEFINARLTEDTRIATAAGYPTWVHEDPEHAPGRIVDTDGNVVVYDEGSPSEEEAAHIVRHQPQRIHAGVRSKIDIVDEYEAMLGHGYTLPDGVHDGRDENERECDQAVLDILERIACFMASEWRDHPDFRPEWWITTPYVPPSASPGADSPK